MAQMTTRLETTLGQSRCVMLRSPRSDVLLVGSHGSGFTATDHDHHISYEVRCAEPDRRFRATRALSLHEPWDTPEVFNAPAVWPVPVQEGPE